MNQKRHLDNEAAQRSAVYAILSRSFLKEPDLELIRFLKIGKIREIFESLDLSLGDDFMEKDEASLIEELSLEYARLFLTPPMHLPPCESFYVGGLQDDMEHFEPFLQGKAADEVRTFYREHGILMPEETGVFPDHIGVELEALRLLCELESLAIESGHPDRVRQLRRITGNFLDEHPKRWMLLFSELILKKAEKPFYRVIAQLTRAFIDSELAELSHCRVEEEEVVL